MQDISHSPPAVRPLHPSMLGRLDPTFVKVYNTHIAPVPEPVNLEQTRQQHSHIYAATRRPETPIGGHGEARVPGWDKYPEEILIRVYVPHGEPEGKREVWPVHFNFPGAGWAVGDHTTDMHLCSHICASVPCCVIDIEYRLAPQWPFPVGILDAAAAVRFVAANPYIFSIDPTRMTLGGQFTGGTIALILNHLLRDVGMGGNIKGVVVGTPSITDVSKIATPQQSPYPSMREFEHAPLLHWPKLKADAWLAHPYAKTAAANQMAMQKDVSWFADALTAPNFKNLASLTWIGTAELDLLRDEGEAYAAKLKENGNNVVVKRYPGMPHGFWHMDKDLDQAVWYVNDVISHIRQCLRS